MARPSLNRATGVGIATNNPDQSPSSGTGRAVLNVRLNGPGRRTRGIEVSPVRPALPKLLRTSRTAVDPQGQCECSGTLVIHKANEDFCSLVLPRNGYMRLKEGELIAHDAIEVRRQVRVEVAA